MLIEGTGNFFDCRGVVQRYRVAGGYQSIGIIGQHKRQNTTPILGNPGAGLRSPDVSDKAVIVQPDQSLVPSVGVPRTRNGLAVDVLD